MINTILLDLDGTVLPMEFDKFMKLYFYHLGNHFSDQLHPQELQKAVMIATDYMINNNNGKTNEEKFMKKFNAFIDGGLQDYIEQFNNFYEKRFDLVKPSTTKSVEMIEAVRLLQKKGYKLILVTNPLFPLKANHKRITWAGVRPEDFSYISSFEQNKYCKPHLEYYKEVLNHIDKKPNECLMVGNDVFDDLPARKLNMKTYLITDHLLNRNNDTITTDYQGNYQQFLEFVHKLPPIS